MERFATNKNGNIDSGTEVLSNNVTFMQQAKDLAISNLFGDLFVEGILNTGNENTMFKITANGDGTFNVGMGIAYKQNFAIEPILYERIAITNSNEIYNAANAQQTTDDGTGDLVVTPKSTGCKNIPIPIAGITYFVDLKYLTVCDNGNTGDGLNLKNYSIAKNETIGSNTQRKRFYKWIDGYEIRLVQTIGEVQGVCLGTVTKDGNNQITITDDERTGHLLVDSKIFIEYFTSGQGIAIKTEGETTTLSVNVDDKTIEIEDNYVRVTRDGLFPFNKFAINSGPTTFLTNPQGNMIALNVSAGLEPLWLCPAYNDRYSITNEDAIVALDVQVEIQSKFSGNAGIYTICINNTDKENNNAKLQVPKLEIMGEVSGGKGTPPNIEYRVWLDTLKQPYKAKWFNGSDWLEYHGVPIGLVQVSAGGTVVALKQFEFNRDYSQWESVASIKPYFGGGIPDKYLLCNGVSTYSILLYNDLYRKIGTKFGGTAGSTFGVPDFVNKVIWGSNSLDVFDYIDSALPNIKGNTMVAATRGNLNTVRQYVTGAFYGEYDIGDSVSVLRWTSAENDTHNYIVSFDASRSSGVYKNNQQIVQPPALQSPVLIKYTI